MKSWKLVEPGRLISETAEATKLTERNNVKVKIEEILLTMSDYRVYTGETKQKYPFIFGRNAVGAVSELYDENSLLRKLDRVVIEPYIPCNACTECQRGDYEDCSDMTELGTNTDGLMQNFIDLPASILHRLPDNISNEKALFVSYVAFCLNIMDALKLDKGRHVAVFSSTKTGLIAAQLLRYYQAVPIFISNREELLSLARELGIFYAFNNETADVEKEIRTVTGGRLCKELVLFSDSDFSMKDVYSVSAVNANICLCGYSGKESKISVSQICQKHLNIFGVYNGAGNFSSAINLLVTNKVNVDELLGDTVSFDNLADELEKMDPFELTVKSKVVKVD